MMKTAIKKQVGYDMKRSEQRARMRRYHAKKSRLCYDKGTEKAWMETYDGDKKSLRMVRRQGSIRHQPKTVRQAYRKPYCSEEDWEFVKDTIEYCVLSECVYQED